MCIIHNICALKINSLNVKKLHKQYSCSIEIFIPKRKFKDFSSTLTKKYCFFKQYFKDGTNCHKIIHDACGKKHILMHCK